MSLALQQLGIPIHIIKLMVHIFHSMHHHLRMGFGNSAKFYISDPDKPLQGILRGNGTSPAVWAAVSTPIINILHCLNAGFKGVTPIMQQPIHIVSFSFVDDTTLLEAMIGKAGLDPVTPVQHNSDLWDEAMDATGGFILARKSFAQFVDQLSQSKNNWVIKRNKQDVEIWMDQGEEQVKLMVLNPEESDCILGMFLHWDGSNKAIQDYLVDKLAKWAKVAKMRWWHWDQIELALLHQIWKVAEYVLLSLTTSKAECHQIVSLALMVALPRMGICKYAPRDAIYNPKEGLGLGVPLLHMLQLIVKI